MVIAPIGDPSLDWHLDDLPKRRLHDQERNGKGTPAAVWGLPVDNPVPNMLISIPGANDWANDAPFPTVVMVGEGDATLSVRICVAEEEVLSVTRTVKLVEPSAVGVPVMVTEGPVEELKLKPGGKLPVSDQLYGARPPAALIVAAYARPTLPFGSEVVETRGGERSLN